MFCRSLSLPVDHACPPVQAPVVIERVAFFAYVSPLGVSSARRSRKGACDALITPPPPVQLARSSQWKYTQSYRNGSDTVTVLEPGSVYDQMTANKTRRRQTPGPTSLPRSLGRAWPVPLIAHHLRHLVPQGLALSWRRWPRQLSFQVKPMSWVRFAGPPGVSGALFGANTGTAWVPPQEGRGGGGGGQPGAS